MMSFRDFERGYVIDVSYDSVTVSPVVCSKQKYSSNGTWRILYSDGRSDVVDKKVIYDHNPTTDEIVKETIKKKQELVNYYVQVKQDWSRKIDEDEADYKNKRKDAQERLDDVDLIIKNLEEQVIKARKGIINGTI